jgi:hypothetical protein
VMQVLEGVRYLPEAQEVHSVSLFAQFWHRGEQAVHIAGAGEGGRYWAEGQSLHTLPASTLGKTQARQVLASVMQSEQGAVQAEQLGYGSGELTYRAVGAFVTSYEPMGADAGRAVGSAGTV